MTLTACDACTCIPGNELQQTYRQNLRKTLCGILDALGGGVASFVTNIPAKTIAFGSLGAAYAAASFLDAEGLARSITVYNTTNQAVQISYDGAEDGPVIPAGVQRTFNYADNGRLLSATDIYIKYLVAPASGSVYLDGFY